MGIIKSTGKVLYRKMLAMRWGKESNLLMKTFLEDYKEHKAKIREIHKIHSCGFCVDDWIYLPVNKDNYHKFLSTVQYMTMHPINGEYSKWIDDKLTLKYLCSGTELDRYFPKYYFQIDDVGNILPLTDYVSDFGRVSPEAVIELLREVKELAVKQIAGSLGIGFYKLEFVNEKFLINGEEKTADELVSLLLTLKNYLIIEYLKPHSDIAQFCPNTTNTIRYLYGKLNNKSMMLKGFVRFGTQKSGFVENYNSGGVLCYLDNEGRFKIGNMLDKKNQTNLTVYEHPDSHVRLDGTIPMWDHIQEIVKKFELHFPQLCYLGFDFVVTDKNEVKILEINSLTSLDSLQIDKSIFESNAAEFFKSRLMK